VYECPFRLPLDDDAPEEGASEEGTAKGGARINGPREGGAPEDEAAEDGARECCPREDVAAVDVESGAGARAFCLPWRIDDVVVDEPEECKLSLEADGYQQRKEKNERKRLDSEVFNEAIVPSTRIYCITRFVGVERPICRLRDA